VCQLHELRQCRRPRDIQKALTQLPATLDETYERILRQLDNEYQPEARAILFWLVSSKRTLTLLELGEAAVIQPTDRQFDLGARFSDASEVLRILGSLITYSMQSNSQELVRFAHYSVQEYLLSGRSATFPTNIETSQQHVTSSCLLYLNHLKLIPDDHLHQYPLLNYVATYWFPHLQEAREVDRIPTELACSLLTKDFTTHVPKWLSVYEPCTEIHGGRELQQTLRYPGALYYAVYLNLLQAVAVLLETGVNVNELHGFGTQDNGTDPEYMVNNDRKRSLVHRQMATHRRRNTTRYRNRLGLSVHGSRIILRQCQTVLHLAVFLGFQPMVELLLELGADPNVKASIGSPLPTFSVESRVGRSEHSGDERCESALGDAVKHNDLNMVKVLLDHGAQADVSCGRYPAFNYAARYGDWSIVSYLLSAGADPNVTGKTLKPCCYPRALLLACSQLFVAGVKDLVHAGAHVNRTDAACTALQVACYSEPQASFSRLPLPARLTISWKPRRRDSLFIAQSLEICEILLGAGADPNLVGRDVARGSPLSEAAKQDSAALMVLLLNNGANCDGAPHPDSITPLAAAVAQGHLAAARLLISFGANVYLSPYDASPIPLALAASRGDLVTIQLLLDAGAHIDAYCKAALEEPLSYALLAAAAVGYENVVRLLLDRGASVLPPAPQHRHAITAAACKGFSRVVEMLIRAGADINAESWTSYEDLKGVCMKCIAMKVDAMNI
jgi:ankyrin repeat protein